MYSLLKKASFIGLYLFSSNLLAYDGLSLITDHAYVGLGLGLSIGQFNINSNTTIPSSSSSFFSTQNSNPQLSNTNMTGILFVGKLFKIKQIWLGPEFSLNIGSPNVLWTNSASVLFPTETLSTSSKNQLNVITGGFDARLGISVNQRNMIYTRLGVAVATFSSNTNAVDARPLVDLSNATTNSFSSTLPGLRAGAGFEQFINDTVSLRGDYVFTYYPSVSQTANGTTVASGFQLGPVNNSLRAQVNTHAVLFELVYHWDTVHEQI